MNRLFLILAGVALVCVTTVTGCYSVKSVEGADETRFEEGQIVFTRGRQYTGLFGSYSPREYFEITYKHFSRNPAGFPVVEVGIRYRGGQDWTNWHKKMPATVQLAATCNFYRGAQNGPIVYSSPRENLLFKLGETTPYKFVCPVKEADDFQLVLGE